MEPLEGALLQAVLAEPQRDDLRLIYADYLEEHGQEQRAEFIRLQIHLAALCQQCGCSQCVKDRGGKLHHNGRCQVRRDEKQAFAREKELLNTCRLLQWVPDGWEGWVPGKQAFQRGFIHCLRMLGDDWNENADAILAQQPICKVEWTATPAFFVGPVIEGSPYHSRYCRLGNRELVRVAFLDYPNIARQRIGLECARAYWPDIDFSIAGDR